MEDSYLLHCIIIEIQYNTGPRSAVGNVSGYRCVSDCRSRGSIPARSHTFVEIDHEIISMVILLPSADAFKKGCCQLQAKVCAQITGKPLVQACPGKRVVRWTDRPAMTIAVDLGRKATKPTNIIKLSHYDETEKRAHDSQIVRAKENLSWTTVGPASAKHQAPTHRLKFCARAVIESEAWPKLSADHKNRC